MRRLATLTCAAALFASGALAQPVTQTGSVKLPNGQLIPISPTTQYNAACNGGAGGIVGQGSCTAPASPSPSPAYNSTAANTQLPCSGTITAGGVSQQLMPATTGRGGYYFQNQSTGPLYIRSASATGTLPATTDQNSIQVAAGQTWIPPIVTDYAYNVIGGTNGQQFHCLRW